MVSGLFPCISGHTTSYASGSDTVHILFLHGMSETPKVLKTLKERIEEIFDEHDITLDFCFPHLPDTESVSEWVKNVAIEIHQWKPYKKMVIVGISMG